MFLSTPIYFHLKSINSSGLAGRRTVFYILLLLLFLQGYSTPAYSESSLALSPDELVKQLQHGGYVLYIRHAATDHSLQDKNLTDFSKCELQRNLSQQGKNESKILGDAIKALAIKVDGIYTSPYCRCIDTAEIAFGRYEIDNDMRATFATNLKDSIHLVNVLRRRLSEIPKQGFNTVLVSHTTNLRELTKIWPKPEGVIHIFQPLGVKGYQHLGRIMPKDWGSLTRPSNENLVD